VAPERTVGALGAVGGSGAACAVEALATGTPAASPATVAAQPSTLRRECTGFPNEPSDDATSAPSAVHDR
jgi:hypothetical protein